jgi:hypothetical protein
MRRLLLLTCLVIAGCSSGGSTATAALEKPTDLPAGWTWHEIEGEKCGFAVPGDWRIMTTKEAQDEPPSVKGSGHDIMRGMAVSALAMDLEVRDRGLVAVAADPIAAAIMVTHRKEDAPFDLSDAAAKTDQQLGAHTMKSDTPPTASSVTLPAGEAKLVSGQLSGASTGQPDMRLNVRHFVLGHGEHRYDINVISTSVGGSDEPDAEAIAKTFRFVR